MKNKIFIASDHAGFKLKNQIAAFLKSKNYNYADLGAKRFIAADDFPDYAEKVARKVKKEKAKGILICRTGQGMAIAANKIKGIIAAPVYNLSTAKHAKEHLNANIITFGAITKTKTATKMVEAWLKSKFLAQAKYIRRLNKINRLR